MQLAPRLHRLALPAQAAEPDTLAALRRAAYVAIVLAAVVQVLFFGEVHGNGNAVVMAAAASLAGVAYALDARRFRAAPVSALILLFFTLTSTCGALLVKTLEGAALADRLLEPEQTFGLLLASQLTLIVADRLYLRSKRLQWLRGVLTTKVVGRLRLLEWPPDAHLWLMGFVGCVSVVMTGTDHESAATFGIGSAGAKLLRAFQILKFAPFLIPFRAACSGAPRLTRPAGLLPLLAYFALLVGISFLSNSRSTFADAIPTVGVALLIALGFGAIRPQQLRPGRLVAIALVAGLAAFVLSRVALAMVVARDYRYFLDASGLLHLTVEALFNSEWLETARSRMDAAVNTGDYSEYYVDSRFFSRFLMTKFHDNIGYYMSLFGADQLAQYREFMVDRFASLLPDPLLRLLGISLDKSTLVISNGDYVVYLADGWGLGGFKTGSMFAEIHGVFGWGFPLVLALAAWMLFVCYDAFAAMTTTDRLVVAPLLLMTSWNLVGTTAAVGLGAETVTAIPSAILRGIPQNLLVYLIAAWAARLLIPARR